MRIRWAFLGLGLLVLAGCSTSEIGQSQTNQAFPKKGDADVRAALANDPEKLKAYEEGKARDAAVEAENRAHDGNGQ